MQNCITYFMNVPKISVIVPCYKVDQYLNRCIESITSQSLKNIEIILIDDKSPDSVPQICDYWCERDERIKVIHKIKNEGLGYARNTGLNIATGEYIAFVDSDDFISPQMYETLYKKSENGKMDAVLCGVIQQLPCEKIKKIRDYDVDTTFTKDLLPLLSLSFLQKTELNQNSRLYMSVWHGIYKRNTINKINLRFYSEREILSEDLPFQIIFFQNANNIKFIPDYLYTYCLNYKSLTSQFCISKFEAALNLRNLLQNIVPQTNKSLFFIDAEYYSRIRYLLKELVSSHNMKFKEKIHFIQSLCKNDFWNKNYLEANKENFKWKYIQQYKLLRSNKPLLLYLFILFDNNVNKKSLRLPHNKFIK